MDVLLLCVWHYGDLTMWAMGGQSQPLTAKNVDRQVIILTLPFSSFPLCQSFIQASLTLYKYRNVRKLLSRPVNKILIIKWDSYEPTKNFLSSMWLISLFYFIVVSELEVSWNQQKTANSWNIFCWLFAIKFDLKQKKKRVNFIP